MYEFYRKDTDYGRTVCRREVEKCWFEGIMLRGIATMFAFACLVSVAFIIGGVQYSWIITVSTFGIALWLGLINFFITEYRYKKYIRELKLSVEQEELEEIYKQETEKLEYMLDVLESTKISDLTLYDIDKRDKIKIDLEGLV